MEIQEQYNEGTYLLLTHVHLRSCRRLPDFLPFRPIPASSLTLYAVRPSNLLFKQTK